ncbi:MAG: DUF502 domain-containing protein [Gammaproteobacteria bacterium]|nr:DUF502 domain-containing protein [Gammaproteobacteria bacterium]
MPIKKYLITGLLAWLPITITIYVLSWMYGLLEGIYLSLIEVLKSLFGNFATNILQTLENIPGIGVIALILVLIGTGALVSNVMGVWWVKFWDSIILQIPFVKSIYSGVKKITGTLFSNSGQAFRHAVLVEFPREGAWTVGFLTGYTNGELSKLLGSDWLCIFVPTTPNPTGGFFFVVEKSKVHILNMGVDEALTYIISMGSVAPSQPNSANSPNN